MPILQPGAVFLDLVRSETFLLNLVLLLLQNFVGLSVSDGYITCGSETNEVVLTSSHLSYC